MSLRTRALNEYLRLTERPHLASASPEDMRRSIETRAKYLFVPALGTKCEPIDLGGVPGLSVLARSAPGDAVIYYIHGGAFIFGSPQVYRAMMSRLSALTGRKAVMPNYKKAPEHPFPAAPDDVRAGWNALVAGGVAAHDIVIGGDSAGGNLALVLLADLMADGADLPRGVFGLSPVTDMTLSSASVKTNAQTDAVLPSERWDDLQHMYLRKHDPTDPRASPINSDFAGAPPVYLSASNSEMLYDDSLRMRDQMVASGVDVTLEIGDDLPHVWPLFRPMIAEADGTLCNIANWIKQLPVRTPES